MKASGKREDAAEHTVRRGASALPPADGVDGTSVVHGDDYSAGAQLRAEQAQGFGDGPELLSSHGLAGAPGWCPRAGKRAEANVGAVANVTSCITPEKNCSSGRRPGCDRHTVRGRGS